MLPTKSNIASYMLPLLAILGTIGPLTAREPNSVNDQVAKVLDRFQAARPQAKELAIYRLDWVPTLQDAKVKAANEKRPILLVVVTNSYGNMRSGHC